MIPISKEEQYEMIISSLIDLSHAEKSDEDPNLLYAQLDNLDDTFGEHGSYLVPEPATDGD